MTGLTKNFSVFDCDGHVNDPDIIWTEYVEPEYRDLVRQTYWKDARLAFLNGRTQVRGGGNNDFPGGHSGMTIAGPGINKKLVRKFHRMAPLTDEQKDYLDHKGSYEPQARVREMDLMGIDQVMIIPTMIVNHLLYAENIEGAYALYRAYNNWLDDYCSAAPNRLYGASMLPIQNPVYCVEELQKSASRKFRVGLIRPVDIKGNYPNRILPGTYGGPTTMDHVYRTFEETGTVLGMHTFPTLPVEESENQTSPGELLIRIATGTDRRVDTGVFSFIFEAMTWLAQVLLSGFLDRYPKLTMAIFESNATWLPALIERCDRQFKLFRNERVAHLDRLPSDAFYNQCFIAFEGDEATAFRQWDIYENIGVWSSDAYHQDGADSWTAIQEMRRAKVPEAVQAKLLGGNARRMYGIEEHFFVREQADIDRPAWFPTVDDKFHQWWQEEAEPRKHRGSFATNGT